EDQVKLRSYLRACALIAGLSAAFVGVSSQIGGSVASADPVGAPLCAHAGKALSGTHANLAVHGNAYVADHAKLNVRGNLALAPGACLDAFSLGTVHVGHNVLVAHGATLALGCAPGSNGPPPQAPCGFTTTHDTVGGSIIALAPQTMYLTAINVAHDVISLGGGPGVHAVGVSFPVKSMRIGGDLIMQGWHGGWIGALRNHVDGNFVFSGNRGSRPGDHGSPDSSEIDANTVGHDLICEGNSPTARFGDAPPPTMNTVRGQAIGECIQLVASGGKKHHAHRSHR
ncbi:MAG: hypothetical protein ACRDNS_15305, partial [Trebonia sp.]